MQGRLDGTSESLRQVTVALGSTSPAHWAPFHVCPSSRANPCLSVSPYEDQDGVL